MKLRSDLVLYIARASSILDVTEKYKWNGPSLRKLIVNCKDDLGSLCITLLRRADYGASEEASEGSAVRGSEAAESSGLSGIASNGRCSWLN